METGENLFQEYIAANQHLLVYGSTENLSLVFEKAKELSDDELKVFLKKLKEHLA